MRTYSAPERDDVEPGTRLTDDVLARLDDDPDATGFSVQDPDVPSGWRDVTWAEFHARVTVLARGLVAGGVQPGARVGLLARTRYEWTVLDYALWWVGAVSVPLYPSASAEQIRLVLADSGAVACVVEHADHLARLTEVRDALPELARIWSIDPLPVGSGAEGDLDALASSGAGVDDRTLERRRTTVGPDTPATVLYTSGTTGAPRGCVLTHGMFLSSLGVLALELDELFGADAATLLVLPLAHVLARVVAVGCVHTGVRLGHHADVTGLGEALRGFRPTFLLTVPRVLETLFNAASQHAHAAGRGRTFDRATRTAIAWSRAHDDGGPGLRLRARHRMLDRLVYSGLRASLGGEVRYAVSGGAPLGERLAHFYRGIGVPVLEGYGLTESTGPLTVNTPAAQRIGTVGRPLPGTTARVDVDGQLLFRGPQVFAGYWSDPEASAAVLTDGWLHTGDLGEIDHEGFVRVTGRQREILITASGKNVAPAVLEDALRAHPLVSQVMAVGDGRPYLGALVTLDPVEARTWARSRSRSERLSDLVRDPDLRAEVQSAVDAANQSVSAAESIRAFGLLPVDWTEESGHLTPSLKLRRHQILRDFRGEVERLYDQGPGGG